MNYYEMPLRLGKRSVVVVVDRYATETPSTYLTPGSYERAEYTCYEKSGAVYVPTDAEQNKIEKHLEKHQKLFMEETEC